MGLYVMEINSIVGAQQYDEKRFTKIDIIKTRKSVAFMLNFLPGQEMREHNHPERELYLYVLIGNGQFLIDGEKVHVKTGDVIYCQADEKIGFINTSDENVSIYVTMTKMEPT